MILYFLNILNPNDFRLFLCCAGKREQEEDDTGEWHGGDE